MGISLLGRSRRGRPTSGWVDGGWRMADAPIFIEASEGVGSYYVPSSVYRTSSFGTLVA